MPLNFFLVECKKNQKKMKIRIPKKITLFLTTKLRLHYFTKQLSIVVLSLFAIVGISILVVTTTTNLLNALEAKRYVDNYFKKNKLSQKTAKYVGRFNQLLVENKLLMKHKQTSYSLEDKNEGVIVARYVLMLSGTYLNFLNYLNTLNNFRMLNKIDSLTLEVESYDTINIDMKIETLYEQI